MGGDEVRVTPAMFPCKLLQCKCLRGVAGKDRSVGKDLGQKMLWKLVLAEMESNGSKFRNGLT